MADEEPDTTDEEPAETQEAEVEEETSGFNWWLLVIPILAVLDLAIVLLYGANMLDTGALPGDPDILYIVIGGVAVLAILLVVEAVLLIGGHPDHLEDEDEPAPGPETPAAREDIPEAASPEGQAPDLEALETDDEVEGRRVVEMARPPKGVVETGVYSTTYVEIDTERVLRVEELVAEKAA